MTPGSRSPLETSFGFTNTPAAPALPVRSGLLAGLGVQHGFGHRLAPIPHREDWERAKPQWKQVHGNDIAEASAPGSACGEVDGLWTRAPGMWTGVVTADCVPILAARRDGSAVAGLHAGWRGTLAGIALGLGKILKGEGQDPAEWVAAVGPSIAPCCFEVSEDLAQRFIAEFTTDLGVPRDVISPRHRILDLQRINALQLLHAGFGEVEILRGACTKCATWKDGSPVFHSYRREGGGTRQLSVIRSKPLS